jgi:hypothetical protein
MLKIAGNLFALIRRALILDIRPAIIFPVLLRETNRWTREQRQQ